MIRIIMRMTMKRIKTMRISQKMFNSKLTKSSFYQTVMKMRITNKTKKRLMF